MKRITYVMPMALIAILATYSAVQVLDVYAPTSRRGVPMVTVDELTYMAWPDKEENGDWEMVFAVSENGQTPEDYVNISNAPTTISDTAEIIANGDSIIVTWWETNPNNEEDTRPVSMTITEEGTEFSEVVELDDIPDGPAITDTMARRGR